MLKLVKPLTLFNQSEGHNMEDDDRDYEVGYGKPPKSWQFKPRQSGNRSGRSKRKNVKSSFTRALTRKHRIVENGKVRLLTAAEIVENQMIAKAAKGEFKPMQYVINEIAKLEIAERKSAKGPQPGELTLEELRKMPEAEVSALYRATIAEMREDKD